MKVKVCGMRDKTNIEALVNQVTPDYIGFIFYDKSPRFVGYDFDPEIMAVIPENIKKVGVFVNASELMVSDAIEMYGLNAVQLHGKETPEFCDLIHNQGVEVIKAFPVNENFDFEQLIDYDDVCDYFLFDTQTKAHGGSGQKFNWQLLKVYDNHKPYFLSGGIGADDALPLLALYGLNIHCVDINSRFETEPAQKDIKLIKRFVDAIS